MPVPTLGLSYPKTLHPTLALLSTSMVELGQSPQEGKELYRRMAWGREFPQSDTMVHPRAVWRVVSSLSGSSTTTTT